ncbi:MAG: Penicillin-binding protein 1F [Lentisphaerae bacterium ADurb.Bin242]|nr:MAG: Penicillin-binding protein 1F [Lentisphaerae bacterium ADurb.Bin242]
MSVPEKGKRVFLLLAAAGLTLLLSAAAAWRFLPRFLDDPMKELRKRTPSRAWFDPSGSCVHLQRSGDYEWRFDVPLEQISAEAVKTFLVEDRRFYSHSGVDYRALARAFKQNLFHGRIVSGASTISMQLAGMTEPRAPRSLLRKLRQMLKARRLEQLYSKDRLLTEYLNRVPFGGQVYGIEAAARCYFGLPASALNRAEASLLCGLPQRPNAYRPDRFPEQALRRRKRVLLLLERQGVIDAKESERIEKEEPLRLRDFRFPSEFVRNTDRENRMYFELAAREAGDSPRVDCAFDAGYSRLLRNVLRSHAASLTSVRDAAGILMETSTGRVVALVGTLDDASGFGGQVNATLAVRSAGSSLKPFVYAEAIHGGRIVMDTFLRDAPLRYGDYSPVNYDGTFRGDVRAAEALSLSLNTPAVRLLAALGTERVVDLFKRLDLLKPDHPPRDGLPLVLGTAGHTLLSMTGAYAALARCGVFFKPTFLTGKTPSGVRVFPRSVCLMTGKMLRTRPLPGCAVDAAWKTGTSNGNRDAWCFAFTPEWTLGVWFGNKDGRASASLRGLESAAPAAAEIMNSLYRGGLRPKWEDFPAEFRTVPLCSRSGLRSDASCRECFPGPVLRDVPLRKCDLCGREGTGESFRILTPAPVRYQAEREGGVTLNLTSDSGKELYWFLDDAYLGRFREKRLSFPCGVHTLRATDDHSDSKPARVTFHVDKTP